MKANLVALLTDFGNNDIYVGCMKGVILAKQPFAKIVDLSHHVPVHDILQASVMLEDAYTYFPKGTVFVCVVDPGVGTTRSLICLKTKRHYFIGPDNGLFFAILKCESGVKIRRIDSKKLVSNSKVSATFHGRDIMAPIAAKLLKKDCFDMLGAKISKIRSLRQPSVRKTQDTLTGEILYFDHFGNAITNIKRADKNFSFWKKCSVHLSRKKLGNLTSNYEGLGRKVGPLFNSSDRLELAAYCQSAQKLGRLKKGQIVRVEV